MPIKGRETRINLNFFADFNAICSYNQVRQSNLVLKKKWLSKDFFFVLWLLSRVKEGGGGMKVTRFTGILGWQLLMNVPSIAAGDLWPEHTSSPSLTVTMNSIEMLSLIKSTHEISIESIWSAVDANGKTHHLLLLPKAQDGIKKKKMTQPCKHCKDNNQRHDVRYICIDCNSAYCSPDSHNNGRDCFISHVRKIVRVLPHHGRHKERFEAGAKLKFEFDKSGFLLVAGTEGSNRTITRFFPLV
jgi:hypothetical protein